MIKIKEIQNNSILENVVNKSKFIAHSFSVCSSKQIESILQDLKKTYSDATHICFAYSLLGGADKAVDDGEPQGTAGKPILDCIKKAGFCNTLVAVVRYFGGIKLGAGGLVRAYSACASKVLTLSGEKIAVQCKKISFCLDISQNKFVEKIRLIQEIQKFEVDYSQSICINIFCTEQDIEKTKEQIKSITKCPLVFELHQDVFFV